jgi:lysozyme family protein
MTASNRLDCLKFTLQYEGGEVDNPKDPGGRTKWGVTQVTYDEFRKTQKLALRSVYDMAEAEMQEIYRQQYWDTINGDSLPKGVDLALFDYAVNSGPARALKDFKGVPMHDTAHAQIEAICTKRLSLMHGLSTWKVFGKGWSRRVAACEALAYTMAYGNSQGPIAPGNAIAQHKSEEAHVSSATHFGAGTAAAGAAISSGISSGLFGVSGWSPYTYILATVAVAALVASAVFFLKSQQQSVRASTLALK